MLVWCGWACENPAAVTQRELLSLFFVELALVFQTPTDTYIYTDDEAAYDYFTRVVYSSSTLREIGVESMYSETC